MHNDFIAYLQAPHISKSKFRGLHWACVQLGVGQSEIEAVNLNERHLQKKHIWQDMTRNFKQHQVVLRKEMSWGTRFQTSM